MITEKRLIDMDDTMNKLRAYAERKHEAETLALLADENNCNIEDITVSIETGTPK